MTPRRHLRLPSDSGGEEEERNVLGGYPRVVSHIETVEILTDLDTGLEDVRLVGTPSSPRVVRRDTDAPTPRKRYSGNQQIFVRGREVTTRPVSHRKRKVSERQHPYAKIRKDLRRQAKGG